MSELLKMASASQRELWDSLGFGYTESAGLPELREAIASLYPGVASENVIASLAPEEGIYLACRAALAGSPAHARVVATWPGYQSLTEVCRSSGAEVVRWNVRESAETGFHFDVADLEKLLAEGPTHIVVVNFPHNPTGALPTRDEWARIVKLVDDSGALLFSDEMYRLLEDDTDRLPSACELSKRAASLSGLSKAYGMPGLRMGWLVSHNQEFMGNVAQYRDYLSICGPAPCEILALIALSNAATITEQHRKRIKFNKAAVQKLMNATQSGPVRFLWRPSKGGPAGLLRIEGSDATPYCHKLTESGVLLLPSSCFEYGEAHIRIGFGRENCVENLKVWAKTLGVADGWLD